MSASCNFQQSNPDILFSTHILSFTTPRLPTFVQLEKNKKLTTKLPEEVGGYEKLRWVFAPSEKGEWRATTPGFEPGAFEAPPGRNDSSDSNDP